MKPQSAIRRLREATRALRARGGPRGLHYITGAQDWSIRQDGIAITSGVQRLHPDLVCELHPDSAGLYHQIVHFGSTWAFFKNIDRTHSSNRLVATIFHGKEGMSAEFDEALALFRRRIDRLSFVVTACHGMGARLQNWGVPAEKLRVIPLGVDLQRFSPVDEEEKRRRKREAGVPEDALCIGSFQKDSRGWGDGMEPKPVKGPDIFVKAVAGLARTHPVHALLTGPSRGYVRSELEKAGVPYTHTYLPDFNDLPRMFGCLDLYLITSREEGGPKAILECMAAGVPFVTSRVGMAPDIIRNGENGVVVEIGDTEAFIRESERLLADTEWRAALVASGLKTVQAYDWAQIARRYDQEVYSALLEDGRKSGDR